jgi:cytosine/adenosine deaminase-related metal-dependent hydrolase
MRRIAAQYLFTGKEAPIRMGCVTLDDEDRIVEVTQLDNVEFGSTEFYNGILIPGFVNTHVHIELSYMKGMITPHTELSGFIAEMMNVPDEKKRELTTDRIVAAISEADLSMWKEGVVAAGDICNTSDSLEMKQKSKIYYHSFVETAGLPESVVKQREMKVREVQAEAKQRGLTATITPHAPYSMNDTLFKFSVEAALKDGILSIHNQESEEEQDLFKDGTGPLRTLFDTKGFVSPHPINNTSIHRLLPLLDKNVHLLLVHNTFTSEADYESVKRKVNNVNWVLCPNSNNYITGHIPPADMFFRKDAQVTIGTDSLASNLQLSMMEEMKTLAHHFPQIPLEILVRWATWNGAKALRKDADFGTIEVGKRPGLVLIEDIDLHELKLTEASRARNMLM